MTNEETPKDEAKTAIEKAEENFRVAQSELRERRLEADAYHALASCPYALTQQRQAAREALETKWPALDTASDAYLAAEKVWRKARLPGNQRSL